MNEGLIDTNVFIHAQATDAHTGECQAFLAALEHDRVRARLALLVLHELSFVLPRIINQMTREDVAAYLLMVVNWPGILCDKELLVDTIDRWRQTPGLSFTDAYLAALAARDECPVFTKNLSELRAPGVEAPRRLPGLQ